MSAAEWVGQLNYSWLVDTLISVLSALLCITLHETCHGLMAHRLGDNTAKKAGRISLNPLRHVDIPGLIMLAVFKFGWAKPVPVDMRKFRHPKSGMALTALAGPAGNLLLALLALVIYFPIAWFLGDEGFYRYLLQFLLQTAVLSCGLAVFNLFPIPPLDGSKILLAILPDSAYEKLMRCEKYGMILLVILLITGLLDTPLNFLHSGLLGILQAAALAPYQLFFSLFHS